MANSTDLALPPLLSIEDERSRREELWREFERERRRLADGLARGSVRNPLAPVVNALHRLIEVRNLAAYKRTWEALVGQVDES